MLVGRLGQFKEFAKRYALTVRDYAQQLRWGAFPKNEWLQVLSLPIEKHTPELLKG